MTITTTTLPPMDIAPHLYYALCAEGMTPQDATAAVWAQYAAIEAQRKSFNKGDRTS